MPNNRVPCKFFAQGGCLKGESCAFSHDQSAPSYNICSYYQKGACSFGSRCRYIHVNDHITDSVLRIDQPDKSALANNLQVSSVIRIDQPICSFAAAGNCRRGQLCPHIHGDLCPTCGKQCLHPFKPREREEHFKTCNKQQKHLEVLNRSQEVECSVCFERVLSKSTPAERKFGILSECDHPFCISCIRNWRSSSSRVMDVNSVLRACPICRKVSYFVVPSVIWYSTKEEKAEIVDSYKNKLRSIDCKYFEYGNGACPFGSSCFYKHIVKEGSNLWNATLMPDIYNSIYVNCDESDDWLSDLEDEDYGTDILTIVSHSPLGEEDEDDFSLEEDELNNAMASLLRLGLTDGSDSSSGDEGA